MHRLPLFLDSPSIHWDRALPEWNLFERTLNKANLDEMISFLQEFVEADERYTKYIISQAGKLLETSEQLLKHSGLLKSGFRILSWLILRVPISSPYLTKALNLRGSAHYSDGYFQLAANDFEMCTYVYKINKAYTLEEICNVYYKLIMCMDRIRSYLKMKKYFRIYKKYKAKLLPDFAQKPEMIQVDDLINQVLQKCDDTLKAIPTYSKEHCKGIPYKGFNHSYNIPSSSSMCFYGIDGIYAKDDFPNASLVFLEDPIVRSLIIPLTDCEVCYKQALQQMYSCLQCRYKTYCSLSCLEKDKLEHNEECIGYQQLTIILLDASNIFRIFVRISKQLHEKIFNSQIFRKLRQAEQVWAKVMELLYGIQSNAIDDLQFLKRKPCYFNLNQMQYSTLVATAFRLTIFIQNKTTVIERFYTKLHLPNRQMLILIGSILMRIHCNILLNSFDFEITKPVGENSMPEHLGFKEMRQMLQTISRADVIADANKFYNVDFYRDIFLKSKEFLVKKNASVVGPSKLTAVNHLKTCDPINRSLSTFKDYIADLTLESQRADDVIWRQSFSSVAPGNICSTIAVMSEVQRIEFVKKFANLFHIHYVKFFIRIKAETRQGWTLYCPTLAEFKHSCEPNVEVMVLENGCVIGKSLRKIMKGEQLFVSYKANYMYHTKVERQKFIDQFNVNCICLYCQQQHFNEPIRFRLAVYCVKCKGTLLTSSDIVCPKCNLEYHTIFNNHRNLIHILENEVNGKSDDRHIYISKSILGECAKVWFPPQNEFRMSIELEMAYFLALRNFGEESYKIITDMLFQISVYYAEETVWFTFYAKILKIIKILLFNNLEDRLSSLTKDELKDIRSIGLYIAERQKRYIEFYEIFDGECSNILHDIAMLMKWRDPIICFDLAKS